MSVIYWISFIIRYFRLICQIENLRLLRTVAFGGGFGELFISLFIIGAVVFCIYDYFAHRDKREAKVSHDLYEPSDEEVLRQANENMAKIAAAIQAQEVGRDDVYRAIMANTYDGQLPERRHDGAWTSIFNNLRILLIAGINHRLNINRYKEIGRASCRERV